MNDVFSSFTARLFLNYFVCQRLHHRYDMNASCLWCVCVCLLLMDERVMMYLMGPRNPGSGGCSNGYFEKCALDFASDLRNSFAQ